MLEPMRFPAPAGQAAKLTKSGGNNARNRFDAVDADDFPPNGIRKSLNNPARCDTSLWIDAVRVQMSYATTKVLQLAD